MSETTHESAQGEKNPAILPQHRQEKSFATASLGSHEQLRVSPINLACKLHIDRQPRISKNVFEPER